MLMLMLMFMTKAVWVLLVCPLLTAHSSDEPPLETSDQEWAVKSYNGGGYAGEAQYDPFRKQLVITGTFWKNGFLGGDGMTLDNNDPNEYMRCFVGVIDVDSMRLGNLDNQPHSVRPIQEASLCSTMTMLYEESPSQTVDENNLEDPSGHNFVSSSSAFLLGNRIYVGGSGTGHHVLPEDWDVPGSAATRIEEAVSLLNLRTMKTRAEKIAASFGRGNDLSAAMKEASLHQGFGKLPQHPAWNQTEYLHQQSAFIYPSSVIAESVGLVRSGYGSRRHYAYIGVVKDDQIPIDFRQETLIGSELRAHKELVFLDVYARGERYNGHTFTSGIQKIDANTGILEWFLDLNNRDTDGSTVVSDLAYLQDRDVLVVAGSTSAVGFAFGEQHDHAGDWDGFVAKVDPVAGALITTESRYADPTSVRISSPSNHSDSVHALCHNGDKLYVVGTTAGKIVGDDTGGAFIRKLDVDNLNTIWTEQLPGIGVQGIACAAGTVHGTKLLYVGGIIPDRTTVRDNKIQLENVERGTGVFVAQLDEQLGTVNWMEEIRYDSQRKRYDTLKSLSLDDDGHVIAYGNSYDPVLRHNDIFVVSVNKETGQSGSPDLLEPLQPSSSSPSSSQDSDSDSDSNSESSDAGNMERLFGQNDLDQNMLVLFALLPLVFAVVVCCLSRSEGKRLADAQTATTTPTSDAPVV